MSFDAEAQFCYLLFHWDRPPANMNCIHWLPPCGLNIILILLQMSGRTFLLELAAMKML